MITHKDGRYLILDLAVNDYRFSLANIYGPNSDSPDFIAEVFDRLEELGNCEMVIGGDFNLTLNDNLDRSVTARYKPNATVKLQNCMIQCELMDVWHTLNPTKVEFSWTRNNPTFVGSRIDFFLCNYGLVNKLLEIQYSPFIKSDHAAVQMVLNFSVHKRRHGYWKFNNTLLQDPAFTQELIAEVDSLKVRLTSMDPITKWEMMKYKLINISQERGKERGNQRKKQFCELKGKLTKARDRKSYNFKQESLAFT